MNALGTRVEKADGVGETDVTDALDYSTEGRNKAATSGAEV